MPYQEHAERCRRLGWEFVGDPISDRLLALADEYDAIAAERARANDAQCRSQDSQCQ